MERLPNQRQLGLVPLGLLASPTLWMAVGLAALAFTTWLMRALQFDVRTAFQSPSEAQLAFESVLGPVPAPRL